MGDKHTPGPWSVIDGHYPSMKEIVGPSFKISIVMAATDLDFEDYLIRSADACLIAAAPDLLEALSAFIGMIDCGNENPQEIVNQGRAAIAKATGEDK